MEKGPLVGGPAPSQDFHEGRSLILPNASSAVGIASSPGMGEFKNIS